MKNYLFNYKNRVRLIRFYSKNLITGKNIADIGAGISPVTPIRSETVFIDISRTALEILRKKGYKTICSSVTNIPLEKKFDTVYCSEVLEHVEDYRKGLKEISRILNKKGRVFITVPCWQEFWNEDDEFVGHYRRFNPEQLKKDLEEVGLKLIKKKKIGSRLERKITIFLVKNFKQERKLNNLMIPAYILVNYVLSWILTLASFFTSERNSSVILFIAEKK